MSRRIGILRTGSMGDHLIALPLYRQIRAAHPQDTLVLLSNIPARGNPKLVGPASFLPPALFDEWHDYPVGSDLGTVLAAYRLFRGVRLNRLYYLMPARTPQQRWRDRAFFTLAGVRVTGLKAVAAIAPAQNSHALPLVEHELHRLARTVGVAARTEPCDLSLDLTAAELTGARALMGTSKCAIVISIGTKLSVNDWGPDKWSQLIVRLATLRKVDLLILIGAVDEYAYSESLRAHWPKTALNLCGRLPPRASAALLSQAKLFVGHDSGPMHMAAAVNVPIVAIFSSRNPPGLWFPLSLHKCIHYSTIDCMGCGKLSCEELRKACIRSIAVADVFDSCMAALGRATTSGHILQFPGSYAKQTQGERG